MGWLLYGIMLLSPLWLVISAVKLIGIQRTIKRVDLPHDKTAAIQERRPVLISFLLSLVTMVLTCVFMFLVMSTTEC